MTVKLGNGRPGLCKWQDKSCAKVKMNCILRHNTGRGGGLILHFPPRAPTPGAGDEKWEVCVGPGVGLNLLRSLGAGRTQHGVVWRRSTKLTESIEAGPSCVTSLPFPLHLQYKLFITAALCFLLYVTVAWVNKVICMRGVCVMESPRRGFKQQNNIHKCMKNSEGVISYKADAQFG